MVGRGLCIGYDNVISSTDEPDRIAYYYNVDVNGKVVSDVAWYAC